MDQSIWFRRLAAIAIRLFPSNYRSYLFCKVLSGEMMNTSCSCSFSHILNIFLNVTSLVCQRFTDLGFAKVAITWSCGLALQDDRFPCLSQYTGVHHAAGMECRCRPHRNVFLLPLLYPSKRPNSRRFSPRAGR